MITILLTFFGGFIAGFIVSAMLEDRVNKNNNSDLRY